MGAAGFLLDVSGPKSTVVYAAEHGAPGGTADDTNALLAVINGAPAGSRIMLAAHTEYRIQADALSWNADGVTLEAIGGNGSTFSTSAPIIRLLSGGGFGVKIGAKENYTGAGLKAGMGLRGIKLNFGGFGFSQAGLLVEGLTKGHFEHFMVANAGKAAPSAVNTIAMRFRAVWDTTFIHYFLHSLYNAGAPIIQFDDYYSDANGNCNNLRWHLGHHEHFDGKLFYSGANSNLDKLEVFHGKFESSVGTDAANNYVFDLSGATQARICDNRFGLIQSSNSKGIVRFGSGCWKVNFSANDYYNCSGVEVLNDTGARGTVVRDNTHVNPDGAMSLVNNSAAPAELQPATLATSAGRSRSMAAFGYTPVQALSVASDAFVPDQASVSVERTVFRQTTTTQGTKIASIYVESMSDVPLNTLLAIRVRRTAAGATAALQVLIGGATVQAYALEDLPTAIAGVTLSGNGTTVTATKTSHGLSSGDRVIIAGANEAGFNSTAGQPVAITVTNANTFTYAGTGSGSATGTITARLCPWQVAYVPLSYGGHLKDLIRSGSTLVDIQYGGSNNQVIDVDGAALLPYGGFISKSTSGDGSTVALANGVQAFIHQPGAALGSFTLQLPTVPVFDQLLPLTFLSSITTLTMQAASGHTLIGGQTRVRAGTSLLLAWRASEKTWYLLDKSCANSPQTIAYAATVTPSINAGNIITIGNLTGAVTIANPGSVPPAGDQVTIFLTQDGTGGRAVTLGAKYRGLFAAGSPTANQKRALSLVSDGTDLWIQGDTGWVT